jgi:hypothetical protein
MTKREVVLARSRAISLKSFGIFRGRSPTKATTFPGGSSLPNLVAEFDGAGTSCHLAKIEGLEANWEQFEHLKGNRLIRSSFNCSGAQQMKFY